MLAEELGIADDLKDLFSCFTLDLDIAAVIISPNGNRRELRTNREYYTELSDILERPKKGVMDRDNFKERLDRLWKYGILDRFKPVLRKGETKLRKPDQYTLSEYGRNQFYHLANLALRVFGEEGMDISPQSFFGRNLSRCHGIICRPEILASFYKDFLDDESLIVKLTNVEVSDKLRIPKEDVKHVVSYLANKGLLEPDSQSLVKIYKVKKDLKNYFKDKLVRKHNCCLLGLRDSYGKGNFQRGFVFDLKTFQEMLSQEGRDINFLSAMALADFIVRDGYFKIEKDNRRSSKVSITDKGKKIAEDFLRPTYRLMTSHLEINQIYAQGTKYFLNEPIKRAVYLRRMLS